MSINGALQVGRSALTASQAGLQVAGNNMANAATPGYHRRAISLVPARDEFIGRNAFVGQGVNIHSIERQIDEALQARLRDAISNEHAALIDQRFLTALETIQNELTDNDLSSMLSEFFNSFSELANNPEDNAIRAVVVQQGASLASRISGMRDEYGIVVSQIDKAVGADVEKVNDILTQIGAINVQIAQVEGSQGQSAALRDHRDQLIDELSGFLDVTVVEQSNGAADILVNSIPIVLAGESRGIDVRTESVGNQIELSLRVAADGTTLSVESGELGALIQQRENVVQPAIDDLDLFANQLIFQVNRLHAQGQGKQGFESVEGTYGVDDVTTNLNATATGLPFSIDNGSFFIHVTHADTGIRTSHRIDVDGDAMSMTDLLNEINTVVAVPNVTASLSIEDELVLAANAGYEISFSEDSSGVLAALGINTYFTGDSASTIGVNERVQDEPNLLAAGLGHVAGSNGTAVAISQLQDVPLDDLAGRSLRTFWLDSVNQLAVQADAANANVSSTILVRESLDAQVQAVSGVSIDEESINLITFQRQFQAAARFISVIDETLQTLLSLA